MSQVHLQSDEFNASSKAEGLLMDCLQLKDSYKDDVQLTPKFLDAKLEWVKYLIRQEKIDVS
jgi:hypothetical protein